MGVPDPMLGKEILAFGFEATALMKFSSILWLILGMTELAHLQAKEERTDMGHGLILACHILAVVQLLLTARRTRGIGKLYSRACSYKPPSGSFQLPIGATRGSLKHVSADT
jgi:hypothetical protein